MAALEHTAARNAKSHSTTQAASPQLGLFEAPAPSPAEVLLDGLDVDALSPREALDLLYRLKQSVRQG